MKSEITTLAGELVTLRAYMPNGPSADEALSTKCTQLAVEREYCLSRLRESDRQLASARREESEMEAYLRNSAREKAMYLHKSEHAILLNAREDELVIDMRNSW